MCVFRCNLPTALKMSRVFYVLLQSYRVEQTSNKSARNINSGEENSLATPARTRIHKLSIMSLALYPQAIPAPHYHNHNAQIHTNPCHGKEKSTEKLQPTASKAISFLWSGKGLVSETNKFFRVSAQRNTLVQKHKENHCLKSTNC